MFIYAVFNYQYIFILALFIYSFMGVEERFPPCQYRYTILYKRNEETLVSFIPRLYLRYKEGSNLNLVPLVHYL